MNSASPLSRTLLAQALSPQCICGNEKQNLGAQPRPFCYACVQELLTRQARSLYTAAYQEVLRLSLEPNNTGLALFAYDLCCDAIAAIRRGAWPARLRVKKSLEEA